MQLEALEFHGEISGSVKVLRRKETEANKASGQQTAETEGRVNEVDDYLEGDLAPTQPMQVSHFFSFKSQASYYISNPYIRVCLTVQRKRQSWNQM